MTQSNLSYLDTFFGPAVPNYSGNNLAKRPTVQYAGAGVTVTDDPVNQQTIVNIPGAGSYATGIGTWLGAPSSANLRAAMTDEVGTGSLVFSADPQFSSTLALASTAGGAKYIFTPAALAASHVINLPLLTGGDNMTLDNFPTTLTQKTINATNNTITDTSAALGDILYFNGTRFVRLPRGTTNQVLTATATTINWAAPSGGGAPGGSNTQIQFNNASAFGGADMTYVSGTGYTIATNNTFLYGKDASAASRKLAGVDNSNYATYADGYIQSKLGGDDFIVSGVYGQIMRGGSQTPLALTDGLTALTVGLFEYNANLNATYSNSTTSATATNLSFSAAASEVWDIVIEGLITTTTSGIRLQLTTPAGATVNGFLMSCSTSAAAFTNFQFSSVNTLATAIGTTAGTYFFRASLTLTMGGTGGTVALAAAGAAATLNQILAGTKMTIKRSVKV